MIYKVKGLYNVPYDRSPCFDYEVECLSPPDVCIHYLAYDSDQFSLTAVQTRCLCHGSLLIDYFSAVQPAHTHDTCRDALLLQSFYTRIYYDKKL